jgi:FkbM family methyltransferase
MNFIKALEHLKKRTVLTWKMWFAPNYFVQFFPKSFAQAGEDRILDYLFHELHIVKPTYLDLGANNPIAFNNTYFLYLKGCRGVCVEPDPSLIRALRKYRRRDTILNIGVGVSTATEADFYVYPEKGLNTFSKEEVEYRNQVGTQKVQKIIKIPLKTINNIIEENFISPPNLLSIDVEGMDLAILTTLDFDKYKPDVICAETITYDEGRGAKKVPQLITFVCSKGYVVYADTHINTIFVNEKFYSHLNPEDKICT